MIRWADPIPVDRAVREFAERLRRERPEVRGIYWYGSWVTGIPTPASDADLVVVVDHDTRPARDRVPDYLPDRFPVSVDLTVLTEEEWDRLPAVAPEWHRTVMSGRRL